MLSAVVLAAGESRRMGGRLKALLPIGGTSFLGKILSDFSALDVGEILVVLGFRHEEILGAVPLSGAQALINERWAEGQLGSLRLGVRHLSLRSDGVLFTPVDHPLVTRVTYEALIDAWRRGKDRIVVPTYNGRKGHPALFPKRLYGRLLEDRLPMGARDLLYSERETVLFVPVSDPGVVQDVDTPEDYTRLLGGMP